MNIYIEGLEQSKYYRLLLQQAGFRRLDLHRETIRYKCEQLAPIIDHLLDEFSVEVFTNSWYEFSLASLKAAIKKNAAAAVADYWDNIPAGTVEQTFNDLYVQKPPVF